MIIGNINLKNNNMENYIVAKCIKQENGKYKEISRVEFDKGFANAVSAFYKEVAAQNQFSIIEPLQIKLIDDNLKITYYEFYIR